MVVAKVIVLCRKLEAILGYQFRDRALLQEAFTHCSWPFKGVPCNQRLEFLGDAVLDIAMTRHFTFTFACVHTPSYAREGFHGKHAARSFSYGQGCGQIP